MHLKKFIQKRNNLQQISLKVNSDKNILLIKIMKLNKQLSFYLENALLNKQIIKELNKEYNVKNKFINSNNNNFLAKTLSVFKKMSKGKELWIYLTEEQKHSTDSYSRYERMILEKVKKSHADFITLGTRAKAFCQDNKLNIIKSFEKNEENIAVILSQIIKILYVEQDYDRVRFVLNTNKIYNDSFTILPMEDLDANKLSKTTSDTKIITDIKNFKIFPSIEKFINSEIDIYLENVVNAFLIESSFYSAKNDLVKANKIIKEIDDEVLKISRQIMKVKRENQIEEIILLTRNNKSFIKDGKGAEDEKNV